MRRIAVPCDGENVSAHFGHAAQFALFDIDPHAGQITGEQFVDAPPHQPGLLPRWIAGQQADVVLAGGMGGRAQQLFGEHGIEVVVGIEADKPRAAVEAFLKGVLSSGGNPCDRGGGDCSG